MTINSPPCPSCDNANVESMGRTHQFHEITFTLQYCPFCNLQYWNPLFIDSALYEETGEELYSAYHADLMGDAKIADSPLAELPLTSGRLLDIGCANGNLMLHAQERGFEVYGIDFDGMSVEKARNKGLENAYAMSLDEFVTHNADRHLLFDVITFFDVLEHQDDPQRFIRQVLELLQPGGYILGKAPNRNRFLQRVRYTLDYDYPPHHLLMWSTESLNHFLAAKGFHHIVCRVPPFDFQRFVWHLEKKVLGRGLAKAIKSRVFKVDKNIANVPCQILEKHTNKRGGLVRLLKKTEDLIFSIFAVPLFPFFKDRGHNILFSARK